MAHILIVDDEIRIRDALKEYAEFEGYTCDLAADGMEAIEKCKLNTYDLIIMDVMMPRLDGFSTVKKLREFSDFRILMLSARGEEYDKLFGFELGIDDYVVKPFSAKEVMARVKSILRRKLNDSHQVKTFEGLVIDEQGRNVYVDNRKINLTPKEFDLLFFLVRNVNIAISREQLLRDVWGYDYYGDDRTIDTHIKMLRNSLGLYGKFIITLRSLGYKFEVINYEK